MNALWKMTSIAMVIGALIAGLAAPALGQRPGRSRNAPPPARRASVAAQRGAGPNCPYWSTGARRNGSGRRAVRGGRGYGRYGYGPGNGLRLRDGSGPNPNCPLKQK